MLRSERARDLAWRASVALVIPATLGACGSNPPSNIKPVDLFPQYRANCDTRIIETEIYDYVDNKRSGDAKFEVTSAPPLRLRFPGLYYIFAPNLKGGAQSAVQVSVLFPDSRPYAERYICGPEGKSSRQGPGRTNVIISSNLAAPTSILSPQDGVLDEAALRRRVRFDLNKSHEMGEFDFYAYNEKIWQGRAEQEKREGGRKLYTASYYAIPRGANTTVKFISCKQTSPTCTLSMFYAGKPVDIIISKENLPEAEQFSDKIVQLISESDLDNKRRI